MDANRFRRAQFAALKQLGWDDADRKRLYADLGLPASSGEFTPLDRAKIIHALNRLTGSTAHADAPATPAAYKQALMGKIEALLADAGLPWAYLNSSKRGPSMVQRLAGVDRIEFAEPDGLKKIVAALAYRAKRQATAP